MNRSHWVRALGSLKLRLAVAALAALALGIGISTAVLVQRAETGTLAERRALETNEAVRIARLLGHQVQMLQNNLAVLSGQLQPALLADATALRQRLQEMPLLMTQFDSITLVDGAGRGLLTMDDKGVRPTAIDIADRGYFQRIKRDGQPLITDPVVSRVSNEVVVLLVQALPQQTGFIIGALRLRSRDLLTGIADTPGLTGRGGAEGALVLVTDPSGRILAHPDRDLISAPLSAEPQIAAVAARWRQAGAPAAAQGMDLSDEARLLGLAAVPGPGWVVWHSTPRSTVLGPLQRARSEALRWAVGLTLALAAALLALLGLLLLPLKRLQARAERLFDGSLDPQSGWPRASGEIGRLERVLRDVGAERAQLESVNRHAMQRLESVMAAAPVGIAFTRDKRFELVSRQFCQLLGRDESELLDQPAESVFISAADYARLGGDVGAAFARGEVYVGEWELARADGSHVWARLRAQPVDPQQTLAGTIWTANDITQEISQRLALEWAATHDPLTGLANRAAFDQRVARVFAARPKSLPAALVVLDLDRFKPINDRFGHAAGDAMLRTISAAAAARLRPADLLVRLGGDEFAVVLERCSAEAAWRVAEDLHAAICQVRLAWEGQLLDVGACAGLAMLDEQTSDPAAWLAAADGACYEAKAAGRNRVHPVRADRARSAQALEPARAQAQAEQAAPQLSSQD